MGKVMLNGREFYCLHRSMTRAQSKAGSEVVIRGRLRREEGGLDAKEWRMVLLCISDDDRDYLVSLYESTEPTDNIITLEDMWGTTHKVYFEELGPEQILPSRGLVKVPVRFVSVEEGA